MPSSDRTVEYDPIVAAVADLVDSGTILLHDSSRAFDRHRSVERQTPEFAVLTVTASGRAAVEQAIRRSIQDKFFLAFWSTLAEGAVGRVPDDRRLKTIPELFDAQAGSMQRVLRITGLRTVTSLPALLRAARATALIQVNGANGTTYGTGFLVSPSLVLTASHVVEPLFTDGVERPVPRRP